MIKVTTRYLATNFIPPFVLGFIFFVGFLITFYMFRIISLIVNKGVEFGVVIEMVINLSVSFFPMAVPLAIFFATIYALNKLSEDSEIIAMRSFGITKFQIFKPFLFCVFLIAATNYSLSSIYIPKANANFRNLIRQISSSGMLASIKPGQFFTDIPNVTLFTEKVSEDGNNFEQVFLQTKSGNEQRVIFAKTGRLEKMDIDESLGTSLRLNLKDGNITKLDPEGLEIEKVLFKEYDYPIFQKEGGAGTANKDSMKTNNELFALVKEKKIAHAELVNLKNSDPEHAKKVKDSFKSLIKTQMEILERVVTFFQIIFFGFVAFSLGVKKGRGPTSNNTVKAIVVLISYYACYFFFVSLANRGVMDPYVASFTPVILLFLIGIYYFKKLDWAS